MSLDPVLKWEKKEILYRFQVTNNPLYIHSYEPDMNDWDPMYADYTDIYQGKSRGELLKGKAARSSSCLI